MAGRTLSIEDRVVVPDGVFELEGYRAWVPSDDYPERVPDLVVEIVSSSSVRKDTTLLPAAYGRAGGREYWLVDARGEDVQFQILRNVGGVMRSPAGSSSAGAQESLVLPGHWTLERTTNRAGRFAYELSHTANP